MRGIHSGTVHDVDLDLQNGSLSNANIALIERPHITSCVAIITFFPSVIVCEIFKYELLNVLVSKL